MTRRDKYPCRQVDPDHFVENDEVRKYMKDLDNITFTQDDYMRLYDCVHCNECETSHERACINNKFLNDGNTMPGLDEVLVNFRANGTPYQSSEMKIKRPAGIPDKSDRLFFMGCLSTIKIPKFTENALAYLQRAAVDFTILDSEICCGYPLYASGAFDDYEAIKAKNMDIFKQYKEILCLCPACYHVFRSDYPDTGARITFIGDYLTPAKERKRGTVKIQHLCQLKNRGRPDVAGKVEKVLRESGYNVKAVPMWCCGGGYGYWGRTDVIDKIALERMEDFKHADYYTTYCSGCYWILKVFGRKARLDGKLVDVFKLLLE
nr:(Fe-S)-binding protein [Candidatus Sigynarchaeota archaeon]